VKNIVKVQVCNLRFIDNIEQIGHSDANIEWSTSDEDVYCGTDSLALKLLSNFFELYSKCFQLHNYDGMDRKLRRVSMQSVSRVMVAVDEYASWADKMSCLPWKEATDAGGPA